MKWRVAVGGVTLFVSVLGTAPNSTVDAVVAPTPLDSVTIENETKSGFRRALFSGNLDADRDGCRTTDEVLIRDSAVAPTIGRRCRVTAGSWLSPYDGVTATRAGAVRVVPLVSLREAWESGAHSWTASRRADFANNLTDTTALTVVTSRVAAQKGERDPSNWLPPLVSYRCTYVANWVNLKLAWGLSMDRSEFVRVRNVLTGCGDASSGSTSPSSTSATTITTVPASNGSTSVTALLDSIAVQPEFPTGYSRSLFPHWKDSDGNGCSAREDVLIRDSITPAQVGSSGCRILGGNWYSPYDGASWSNPSDVDIDHVVALKEAWDSGAHAWTTQRRTEYANDLSDSRTLIAVTGSVNRSKSDKDPAQWLPPLASYHCTYLSSWVSVKARWGLSMDTAERNAVTSGLAKCTGTVVSTSPVVSTTSTVPATNASVPATTQTTSPSGLAAGFVTPGAFCTPQGALGVSSKGVIYTCKTSETDTRARWRR